MDDATASVQLENSTTRVTRWDLPPGSHTGHHIHEYDYVVVPVTDGVLTITAADGDVIETPLRCGVAYGRTAGVEHDVANTSDRPVAFVEIELLEHPR